MCGMPAQAGGSSSCAICCSCLTGGIWLSAVGKGVGEKGEYIVGATIVRCIKFCTRQRSHEAG